MPDLTKSTGQAISFDVGGKKLILSPITIGDLAAFERHAKEQRLDLFIQTARKADMDKDEKMEGITRILTIPFTSEDFAAEMATTSGIRFLIHRSIAKKHPEFTLAEVDELSDLEELMNVVTAISSLGRMPTDGPPEEGAEEKENDSTGTNPSPK